MTEILERVLPFWNTLSDIDKNRIVDTLQIQEFKKNDIIYHASHEKIGLKLVVNGRVRVFISTPDGNEMTLYRLSEGKVCVLSIACMMNIYQIDINVLAEQDSTLCMIPKDIYEDLSDRYKEVRVFSNQVLTERLGEIINIVSDLAFVKISKRLADDLIEHSKLNHSDTFSITHEELARDIGSAREVVSRTLKHFETLELVSLGRGKITIIDKEGLSKV